MKFSAAIFLLLATAASAVLPLGPVFNQKNLVIPVFQKAFFKTKPSSSNAQPYNFHAMICIDNGGFCSGALIENDKIITTAQCIKGASNFEIHFNALNIYDESDPQRLVVSANRFVTHDQFFANAEGALNDIAIIYLDSPLEGIVPVQLPAKSDNYPLDNYLSVKGIGYGLEDASEVTDGRSIQPFLTASSMSTMPFGQCKGNYGPFLDDQYHICAYAPAISSCYGDPGSPLVYEPLIGDYNLIGLASFASRAPCESGAPIIFTHIRGYLDWLEINGVTIVE